MQVGETSIWTSGKDLIVPYLPVLFLLLLCKTGDRMEVGVFNGVKVFVGFR